MEDVPGLVAQEHADAGRIFDSETCGSEIVDFVAASDFLRRK
jgi:hypothetical protein